MHTGAISPDETYCLVLLIKDGGPYDLDGEANGTVVDPSVIVRAAGGGSGSGSNNASDSNAGGGCDGGTLAGAALAACVFRALGRKAKKWRRSQGTAKDHISH